MKPTQFFLIVIIILAAGCKNAPQNNTAKVDRGAVNNMQVDTSSSNAVKVEGGKTTLDSLQGVWVAPDNSKNGINIVGDTLYDFTDNTNFDTSVMYLNTKCITDKSQLTQGIKTGTVLKHIFFIGRVFYVLLHRLFDRG